MDRKVSTSKETTMETTEAMIDAVEVNALLDVIIKAKDSPGFAVIHKAALDRLMDIVASLTPQAPEEEAPPAQYQQTQSDQVERRL